MASFFYKILAAIVLLGAMWGLSRVDRPEPTAGSVRILRFYASVGLVHHGESAEICYGVENAKSVRISPPIPNVYPSARRCLEVVPEHTTHYTILAEGYDGRVAMQSLTLPVQTVPAVLSPSVHFALARYLFYTAAASQPR